MRYRARVEVSLKEGYYDPEGETAKDSLRDLGYEVEEVRVNKQFNIVFEADSLESAKEEIDEMSRRLLSNPVKDKYSFQIEELG